MKKNAIAAIGIGIVILVIAGAIFYYSILPPNILISEIKIDSFDNNRLITVLDLGRVSGLQSFSYESKDGGQYTLYFDNSFSIISDKSVSVEYNDNGKFYQDDLLVPAGIYKTITVSAEPESKVSGNMQIHGGSGNDVNFNIKTNECKRKVDFSFSLTNSGPVSGDATVQLVLGGKNYWSNNYVLNPDEKITRSESVTIPKCDSTPKVVLSDQKNAGYFSAFFR